MRITRFLRWIAAGIACAIVLPLAAQQPAPTPAAPPRVALVLSGGGARGIAHIGVLKALRDARVPVDFIVATSMGSIVGGAYAAGMTPEAMEALVNEADWEQMFADRPPREDLSFRRKEDDLRLIGRTEFGVKKEGIVLPSGAFGAQNLEAFLRRISRTAGDARTLDDLPILFRAVATDLTTGEGVVLRDVSLPLAMRASMSIPGAFAPTEIDGRLLADGGLVRNLPVEAARELGADIIIAVNVGTPLLPRETLSSALGVAQQMINILTEQNVGISLEALRPRDLLISPDLRGMSFVDFERAPELIARGESAGRAAAARLAALSVDATRYAAWEARRTRQSVLPEIVVAEVRVEGAVRSNAEALRHEIDERADIAPGKLVTADQLDKASRLLHGSGDYQRVDVRSHIEQGRRIVVVDVEEKPWGPNYLRVGGYAISDFHTDGHFSLILQHTHTWLNRWGAEWRLELQLGDLRRFSTSVYQPLGPGSPWFMEALAQTIKSDFDIYAEGVKGFRRTDRVTSSTLEAAAAFGRRIGNTGVARIGAGHARYGTQPAISSRIEGTTKDGADYAWAGYNYDTLDDANFPRRGATWRVSGTRYRFDDGTSSSGYMAEALVPVTFGRLTFLGIGSYGRATDERTGYGLGGLFSLSGTPVGAITGSQVALASGLAYWRVGELPRGLGRGWYAGISLEAGNAWHEHSGIRYGDLRKAGSVYMGFDTVIGPLYAGWGKTFGGESAFYLFLGRPSNQARTGF